MEATASSVLSAGAPESVDIRLLGPLEVASGGVKIPLGGPRLRSLFGLLALRAPRVVSKSALIDGLWSHHPPTGSATTLRAHIAYLRRRLAGARLGGLITTAPPGYALTVRPVCIDSHRFEKLVSKGRAASAGGFYEESVRHFTNALNLWRGDVLADCSLGDWAKAEAIRLQEMRLYTIEDLLTAELAIGRHAHVAAELESLVLRHPLRERLWELLMIALFRSGRQGDALRAYQRVRGVLIEELGVEPGGELQRLEAAILAATARWPTLPRL